MSYEVLSIQHQVGTTFTTTARSSYSWSQDAILTNNLKVLSITNTSDSEYFVHAKGKLVEHQLQCKKT